MPRSGYREQPRVLTPGNPGTFGINNVFDTRPPYSADWYQSYDPSNANYIQRYFWMSIDKKF